MPIIVAPIIPTPVVVQSALGDAAWDYLPQYIPDADDGTVRALLDSLAAPVVGVVDVLTDPATSQPSATPFGRVPWLAAMAGIDISTVASDARKRAVIGDAAWHPRGRWTRSANGRGDADRGEERRDRHELPGRP